MSNILSYGPGQVATIIHQVFNADGYRADGYNFINSGPLGVPMVTRVVYPDLTLAANYPAAMKKIDTGLYTFSLTLPSGAISVGSYIVDISWYHPTTHTLQQDLVQIVVTAPFGQYSVTTAT